jgi:uncharacterized protein YdeI (YjbR/CyaY-like superfamily)
MKEQDDVRFFASREEWEAWLTQVHDTSPGVWLKLAKKGAAGIAYATALEVALCYGWIDGQKRPLDDTHWLQRFTHRTPRSKWSKINRDKAEVLIAGGRMQPPGLREVELAKADGRWEQAYASQSNAAVPDDLQRALDERPKARAFFETLDRANRYAVLYRVHEAKKPDTRAKRISKFVEMLDAHQTIHPVRKGSK